MESAEPHLVAVLGIGPKVQIDRRQINRIGDAFARRKLDRVLLDLLLAQAKEPVLGARLVLDLDHAVVRELHQSRHERAILHRAAVHQGREDRRVIVRRQVAEVRLVKNGLGARIPGFTQVDNDTEHDCGCANERCGPYHDDGARTGALGIGCLRPLAFFGLDDIEAGFACRRQARHPPGGKRGADLSELTGMHTRGCQRNRRILDILADVIDRDLAVEGTVAPRPRHAHRVRPDLGRQASRTGKRHVEIDVLGVFLPFGPDELPIQLGSIGPRHDGALDHVADPHGRLVAVLARQEHLETKRVALVLHRVRIAIAGVRRRDLAHGLRRTASLGFVLGGVVELVHGENRDRRRRSLLILDKGDVPVDAVDRVLELEGAGLGYEQVAILHDLRLNVHARQGIRVGVGGMGKCKRRSKGDKGDQHGQQKRTQRGANERARA